MKRLYILLILICILLASCKETAVETALPKAEATEAITLPLQATVEETTVPNTTEASEIIETAAITTAEVTTAAATTANTTAITTAALTATAPQPKPQPQKSPHIKTVLDGEYTYGEGAEPVIEDIDGFTYVNGILIVNKTYSLPKDYNPGELNPDAKAAFEEMRAAAAAEGLTLKIISGFRSYSQQYSTYNNYSKRDGKELADRYSARAGHSEHQSGFAMDLNSLNQSFGDTAEGIWLAEHCAEYGFILRYGKDKEDSTGFMYEPWHIRYLGVDIATAVTESGLSLEEYLGITSKYPAESE